MEAVREREREHMPLIGPSVDRRSLAYVHQVCRSETVEALMCFTCGQIHTHVACWDRLWREPPQANALNSTSFKGKSAQSSGSPHPSPATDRYNNSRSPISFHKVRDSLFKLLIRKPWESAEDTAHARQAYNKNLLKAEFMERFASVHNGTSEPWTDASELSEKDTEWQRSLRVEGTLFGQALPTRTDRLICCPEDSKPCATCSSTRDSMCGDCEVALCSDCGDAFLKEPRMIEMGLCSDNLWGYTN